MDLWAAPIVLVWRQRLGSCPAHVIHVIDRAFDGRERTAFLSQLNAGLHGVIAHKLHNLRAEFLAQLRSITYADVVHQVGQSP